MLSSFKGYKRPFKYNLYEIFNNIDALYLTTNIDNHFNKQFLHDRVIYKFDDPNDLNIYHNKLYKIHGTLCDIKNIVFTVPDYIKLYNNEVFINFLKKIFASFTVVFVGYGMEEFELLDFLITKIGESQEIRHYILKPYFKGDEQLLNFDKMYFNSMGVEVIGFSKDTNGYNQLYNVIKYWHDKITMTSTLLYDNSANLGEFINGFKRET